MGVLPVGRSQSSGVSLCWGRGREGVRAQGARGRTVQRASGRGGLWDFPLRGTGSHWKASHRNTRNEALSVLWLTGGLTPGSHTRGRHPVRLPEENLAPSPHLGAAETPNIHSKAPREEGCPEHPCHAHVRSPGLAAPPESAGQSSNPSSSKPQLLLVNKGHPALPHGL